jgi:RecB family exonuclease
MSPPEGTMVCVTVAPEQLGFADMPRRLFMCTPSKLTAFVDCPRRYRMTYLDRPRPSAGPPWAHNSFGASVHAALAGWWRLPPAGRRAASVDGLLDAAWSVQGYRDQAQADGWLGRGRAMVARCIATFDHDREPAGVERTLGARTRRLALSGRVDRLDDRDGQLVVVDYKTGRRPLSIDDARGSLALALYALAAAATLRRPCVRVELHHLPTGDVHAFEHTDESLRRQLGRAEEIADEAVAATSAPPETDPFPPRPGTQCGWCDFRAHCPEGAAASPARLPWAALGEPGAPLGEPE